jgi:hypothetical protein
MFQKEHWSVMLQNEGLLSYNIFKIPATWPEHTF